MGRPKGSKNKPKAVPTVIATKGGITKKDTAFPALSRKERLECLKQENKKIEEVKSVSDPFHKNKLYEIIDYIIPRMSKEEQEYMSREARKHCIPLRDMVVIHLIGYFRLDEAALKKHIQSKYKKQ